MVGFEGTSPPESLIDLLDDELVTGVILFSRNIENATQLKALTRALLAHRPDLIIAVDQEGGPVQRIKDGVPRVPAMRDIIDPADAFRYGEELGRALVELGVNLNLAPVLDVDTNPNSPVIGERSFGPDPSHVAKLGVAYHRGLRKGGVLTCGKHFPGHGDAKEDSHLTLPVIQHGLDRLRRVEFVPFRAAIDAGISAIMTAHIVVPALDPETPATLSVGIMTELLRGLMSFEGVVISDDLEMKAISERYPIDRSVAEAIEAGVDMLLVCKDLETQRRALAALRRTPLTRLNKSLDRIEAMRQSR